MRLFLNSLAASAGGGLTYIRNVIPHLAANPDFEVTVAVNSKIRKEFCAFDNIDFLELDVPASRRFWYEQTKLPALIRSYRADILLSAGNFGLWNSPVPQILLSRNSIYTSADYYRDLRTRHEYRLWVDTCVRSVLAKKSIHWADVTVAPSEAFATELRRWTKVPVQAIHHGFDDSGFVRDSTPLAPEIDQKLQDVEGFFKLLFVSHYNYYRNFETLFRALPLIRERLPNRPIKLLLTCKLALGENPGAYNPAAAAKLVKELGIADMVIEFGSIPYTQLHHLYSRADIYITPAYTETFAHPLVEAMFSGLPVVASDLAVHREICGEAAEYFPRFSPEALAKCVVQLAESPETLERMADRGKKRARQFSWKDHVGKIIDLAQTLMDLNSRGIAKSIS